MKYYLIELNDYEQKVITQQQLNKIKEVSDEYDGFMGIMVLREATEEEHNEYLEDEYIKYLNTII